MKFREITIGENEANQRCDRFLKKYLPNSSAGNIFKLLRKKIIRVNGKKVNQDYYLQVGDTMQFKMDSKVLDTLTGEKPRINMQISTDFKVIYEDKNILLVDKPAGVVTHPAKKHERNSLVDMVKKYLFEKKEYDPKKELTFSPASVNRLDINTSGLVLFAKNNTSLQLLNKIIRKRSVRKFYLALVKGSLEGEAELIGYLSKDQQTNTARISNLPAASASSMHSKRQPKKVITRYKKLSSNAYGTLLEVELVTGLPHQIRAHLKHIGHPLAGDPKYGDKKLNAVLRKDFGLKRQFLHAHALKLEECSEPLQYLSGKTFYCPLPDELRKIEKKA